MTLMPLAWNAAGNHPENDTNPTAAPTRSANVCFARMVVLGPVGCKALLGSAEVVVIAQKQKGPAHKAGLCHILA